MPTRNSNVYTAPAGGEEREANLNLRPNNPHANLGTGDFNIRCLVQRHQFATDGTPQGFINAIAHIDNTPSITYVFTNTKSNANGNIYVGQSINGIHTRYNNVASISGGLQTLIAGEQNFEVTIYESAWPEVIEAFWIQYFWQQPNHDGLTNIRQ